MPAGLAGGSPDLPGGARADIDLARDGQREHTASFGAVCDRDPAALGFHQLLDDEQPQARTPDVAVLGALDSVELVEDSRLGPVVDTDAAVRHPYTNDLAVGGHANVNNGALRRGLDGVFDQVAQ